MLANLRNKMKPSCKISFMIDHKAIVDDLNDTENGSAECENAELDTASVSGPSGDSSSEIVSDEWDLVNIQPGNVELSVESALLWCLNPAIYGIKSIGVLPASERARQLVRDCEGDTNGAVALASGGESGGIKRTRIIFEFLIRQVPLVGCPAFILTSTWTHLRSVAIIAAIYGHDIETPRTQHEILWCLIPSNGESTPDETTRVSGDAGPISATAKTVSNVLISTAVKKATGISMVSELFQLGTDLWAVSCRQDPRPGDDDGFECVTLGPAATARHYFCPESTFSVWKLGLVALGIVVPFAYRLPVIVSTTLLLFMMAITLTWKTIRARYIHNLILGNFPKIFSHAIFGLHASLPVIGLANGINLFMSSISTFDNHSSSDRISLAVMSMVSLTGAFKHLLPSQSSADQMTGLHEFSRKLAIVVGVILHVLPLLDRSGVYVSRIAWLLSDTRLSPMSRSLHYMSVIVSSTCQQLLFSELKKREVLLRLLGAERIMVLSLTLFFRGITAAVTSDSLMPYFRQVSPHPLFCCLIMCIRKYPIQLSLLLSLIPRLPFWISPYYGGGHLVMLVGLIVGSSVVITVWNDWQQNENAYLSHMRMLYILPGTLTGKTKDVVDKMLLASGKSAMKKIFVNYVRKFIPNFRKS